MEQVMKSADGVWNSAPARAWFSVNRWALLFAVDAVEKLLGQRLVQRTMTDDA